ncbi:ectoine/hydroxyectoine ABC transporter permease subunit EhuD [Neorhizobium galegae]|uniref:ectoine/hydroxyectoine ABC transporter permease subunit EhuD n=1 Tax=Neorhizobium galegae TaxID=399 RepID=UPI00062293CE|nr:ectoine/hydroxyectoine ABC transporter permease subunit EhuD [Neorhizobium galegae]CDZ64576.1 Ectoine/hydroxyectoine ABC transporter, permease protein EhuD [Neorhizobium galegae bv. orientalis]KAB1119970.1 ectoine/hydroxyectoine ABC transporter permease subunit EhuD [Neorhizobium galegae]MCQ1575284.1 ectoine/hydroxyectoine ABC transporter permease subunit EhuD [Neorhizobium galegae]MCQ1808951.1 ectoine/hydroxyectoine ABC transporter permease subunit EhuD [Neorhizobium galegae]MCQ1838734.1 e
MTFDFAFALRIVPQVLEGIGNTVLVAILAFIGASVLGFIWEILRRSTPRGRPVVQFVIDAIRSTPVLAQLYFLFYVLPYYGIVLPAMVVGVVGLSFYYSGYMSEVFRAGIDAIPRGQGEAAQSLGISRLDTIAFVIAPQMLRNVAAPLGAYSVSILKATPYLAVIAVPEMLGSALDVASETYRYAEPMFVAGILFLCLALIAVSLVGWLERYLGVTTPSH